MKKRFLAMLLCLSVLLMACACAAETMEPPAVSETESQAPTPQFTLSEVNAESSKTEEPTAPSETAPAESEPQETISMEESDIELEPIQPIVPVEKETTLEFLREFPVGENGIWISMNYYDDATNATLECPSDYFADEKGNVYYFWHDFFFDLQTGKKLKIPYSTDFFRAFAAYDGNLYGITESGKLKTYSMDKGHLSTVQIGSSEEDNTQVLFVQNDGTIAVKKQKMLYDAQGKTVSDFPIQYTKEDGATDGVLTIYGKSIFCKNYGILLDGGMGSFTAWKREYKNFGEGCYYYEWLYTQYGTNGDILSQFKLMRSARGERKECSIFDNSGKECKYYRSSTVELGKNVFDGVLRCNLFQGADNTLYLMLLYPDRGELYCVNPGYSDIGLSNLDEMTLEDFMDPMEEFSVGSSFLSGDGNSRASAPLHVPLDRDMVKNRANYVINVPWILTDEHLYVRSDHTDHVEFPKCISNAVDSVAGANFSITLTGIPYCVGGMNGYETFDDSNYLYRNFFDNLFRTAKDGYAFTVGNIGDSWVDSSGHNKLVPLTIGVDCSGFLGSICGIETKKAPSDLDSYGHQITDLNKLNTHDFIIDGTTHCYFFVELIKTANPDTGEMEITGVKVQDCTRADETQHKTSERILDLDDIEGVSFYSPYYEIERTATHHSYSCSWIVDEEGHQCTSPVEEAHDWETPDTTKPNERYCKICRYCAQHNFVYTWTALGHVGRCTVCDSPTALTPHNFEVTGVAGAHFFDCSLCGFSSGPIPHTFSTTYTHTATQHARPCTECGYSVPEAHTFTYTTYSLTKHRKTCSTCGYSALAPHLLGYSYDADGHWQECSVCSYETASLAHNFANSECTVCGCPQFIIMDIIAIPEEDEPLPVPEDQKATL